MNKVTPAEQRYLRNLALARYLGLSQMGLYRWKRDPALGTPPASIINGIEYNDVEAWDAWLRDRAVSMIKTRKAG